MIAARALDPDKPALDRAAFSDADFQVIARLAQHDFGLNLQVSKRDLVYSRLHKRLRVLNLPRFSDYCALLQGPDGADERMHMLSALTTNVTQFFREDHHFKMLREEILPGLLQTAKDGGRVRLWSAGCSAGQEAYSLALTVLGLMPDAQRLNLRILATDVDPEILIKAEAGIYPNDELKAIPDALRSKYTIAAQPGTFAIGDAPRSLITFGQINLIDTWPIKGPFDAIFCRNVAIYFDKSTQSRLWARFADLLTPDGHLFIGHSERLNGPAEQMFHGAGVTAYQRNGSTPDRSGFAAPHPNSSEGTGP